MLKGKQNNEQKVAFLNYNSHRIDSEQVYVLIGIYITLYRHITALYINIKLMTTLFLGSIYVKTYLFRLF
jgi:hypothetical protein